MCRWLFGTLLTARYSGSSETKYEEDLGRVRDASKADPTAFVQTLDDMLSDVLTNDYWNQTLVSALDTQRGRAPAALGFRAAQVILGAQGFVRRSTIAKSACSSRWGRPRGERNASPVSEGVAP